MNWQQWVLIIDLTLSGLIVFARGVAGGTRTYSMTDAVCAVLEVGFLVWLVTTL